MGISVNFEDTYGIADIACHKFFNCTMDVNTNIW